jgi:hypothetical protein
MVGYSFDVKSRPAASKGVEVERNLVEGFKETWDYWWSDMQIAIEIDHSSSLIGRHMGPVCSKREVDTSGRDEKRGGHYDKTKRGANHQESRFQASEKSPRLCYVTCNVNDALENEQEGAVYIFFILQS